MLTQQSRSKGRNRVEGKLAIFCLKSRSELKSNRPTRVLSDRSKADSIGWLLAVEASVCTPMCAYLLWLCGSRPKVVSFKTRCPSDEICESITRRAVKILETNNQKSASGCGSLSFELPACGTYNTQSGHAELREQRVQWLQQTAKHKVSGKPFSSPSGLSKYTSCYGSTSRLEWRTHGLVGFSKALSVFAFVGRQRRRHELTSFRW